MARRNIIGFETGTTEEPYSVSGTVSVSSSPALSGTYSLRTNPTTSGTGFFLVGEHDGVSGTIVAGPVHFILLGAADLYVSFLFRVDTLPSSNTEPFFQAMDTTPAQKLELRLNSSGNIVLYDQSGSAVATSSLALSTGTQYRIKVYIPTGASSTVTVKVDDSTEINQSSVNVTANNTDYIVFGKNANRNSESVDYYFDDIVLDDSEEPGDTSIINLIPDGVGDTQEFTTGTGSTEAEVDEIPPDTGTYVQSPNSRSAYTSLFTMQSCADVGIDGMSYFSIKPWHHSFRTTVGTPAPTLNYKTGGTLYTIFASNLAYTYNPDYTHYARTLQTDPDTSVDWTESAIDAIQGGPAKSGTGGSQQIRCTATGVMVEYGTASGGGGAVTPVPTLALLGVG